MFPKRRPILIRKCKYCGGWHVWHIIQSGGYFFANELEHFDTFGDVLVRLNGRVRV